MKIGIITQARMTSSRLPKKVLLPLGEQSVLSHHINRLQKSEVPVFIATTTNQTDDPIVEFCQQNNVPFYRGSEDHVLSRFYYCALQYELDIIVRVTSDCPLIDGPLIRKSVIKYVERNNLDVYLSNCIERTFPRGLDFEIFSFKLLKEAYEKAILKVDIEHVTPFIHQKRAKNVIFHHILNHTDKSNYRITLDTEDDYKLLQLLVEKHNAHLMNSQELINCLDKNQDLNNINKHIEQKKLGE